MPRLVFSFRALKDHCNGLFLYEAWNTYYVCNPATRRWARLPERMEKGDYAAAYLVFDPEMSLEYEVVLLPWPPGTAPSWYRPAGRPETAEPSMGLPLPELKMDVFSSRTGRWEARRLVREGGAVAIVADVLSEHEEPRRRYGGPEGRYAEYWKGALYVHCRGSFVMRLSLSDNIYRATKTPIFVSDNEDINTRLNEYDNGHWYGKVSEKEDYLGRSEKGIYFVTLHKLQIWVWSLNESGQLIEWVLQHHSDIAPLYKTLFNNDIQYFNESWVLEDYHSDSEYNEYDCHGEDSDGEEEDEVEDSSQHNSDNTDGDDDEKNGGVEEDNEEHGNSQQSPEDSDNGDGEEEEYSEWNSDDDYSLEIKYSSDDLTSSDFYFLGFHPYKEVIFLAESYRVVAYHLGNCKAQYLGHRGPRGFGRSHCATFLESFPYTPCFIDALPKSRHR